MEEVGNRKETGWQQTAEVLAGNMPVYLRPAGGGQLQLLSYHELGRIKYASLGIAYTLEGLEKPGNKACRQRLDRLAERAAAFGLPAVVGSSAKLER